MLSFASANSYMLGTPCATADMCKVDCVRWQIAPAWASVVAESRALNSGDRRQRQALSGASWGVPLHTGSPCFCQVNATESTATVTLQESRAGEVRAAMAQCIWAKATLLRQA
jgi:hypothetical protein